MKIKFFVVVLFLAFFFVLGVFFAVEEACSQEIGYRWTGGKSVELYLEPYLDAQYLGAIPPCAGCYQTHEFLRLNDPVSWWVIGVELNPGYALDFYDETSYVIVTDDKGNVYQSVEWLISTRMGTGYWSSTFGRAAVLTHGLMRNSVGHNQMFFRFQWNDRPERIVNCQFVNIKPRRLFK